MNVVGFLTIHDRGYQGSSDLNDLINEVQNKNENIERVISYLDSGYDFTGVPLMLYDDDDIPMFGLSYLTDGKWIWPNYYSYYLKKYPFIKLNKEFVNYIEAMNYIPQMPSIEQVKEIDDFFNVNIWGV
ncbi:MAG: hypothetical protein LBI73_07035 [Myroides sp.]|jgi:hypothetical protein|nr:hypothetical protein [Myroides sp.]